MRWMPKGWEQVLNDFVFKRDERADDLLGRLFAGSWSMISFKDGGS
jgi:hypothetical protein